MCPPASWKGEAAFRNASGAVITGEGAIIFGEDPFRTVVDEAYRLVNDATVIDL